MQDPTRRVAYRKPDTRQTIGLAVLVCTSVLPALVLTRFLPDFGILTFGLMTWLVISIIGGAIGGSLATTKLQYWYVGLIAGILIGPGMLLATYYYTVWRTTIINIEIVIPMILGALPGMIFVVIVTMIARKRALARNTTLPVQNLPANPYQQALQANQPQFPAYQYPPQQAPQPQQAYPQVAPQQGLPTSQYPPNPQGPSQPGNHFSQGRN